MVSFRLFRLKRLYASPLRALASLVVLAAIVILVLELTNVTHIFHKKIIASTIPTSAHTSQNTNSSNAAKSGAGVSNGAPITSSPNTSTTLIAPYGSFVSNHHPGQNSSPTTEQSLCTTTPGATCYIKFTQNNIIKSLPVQTVDSSGVTTWAWDINQAGLTSGSWKIEAVAGLNGQTKSTADPIALEVQ